MKMKTLCCALIFSAAMSLQSQTMTWIQPPTPATNQSLLIGPGQVMEVLSLTLDNSTSLDITVGTETLTLGTGGNPIIPQPLVVAGPATFSMRKPTSGDRGSMLTFRILQVDSRPDARGQTAGK